MASRDFKEENGKEGFKKNMKKVPDSPAIALLMPTGLTLK
jgi:hypothetical protein